MPARRRYPYANGDGYVRSVGAGACGVGGENAVAARAGGRSRGPGRAQRGAHRIRRFDERVRDTGGDGRGRRGIHRPRDDRRWPRPDLQRRRLRRVSHDAAARRLEPGHRAPRRLLQRLDVHRSPRRLADPGPRDASEHPGARAPRPQRDCAARLAQRARRRLRRGDRFRRSPRHLELAAGRPARLVHPDSRARSARPESRRPLRLEEPARQPAVVLRRRLQERDGHHQPARTGGEHVQRRRARPRVRSAPRAGRRWRGRELFARFMRATKAPPVDAARAASAAAQAGSNCSTRSAAPPVTCATSPPRRRER